MKSSVIALALLLPAGCLAMTQPVAEDTCGADGFADLIGQPGSVAEAMTFAGPVRILDWNQPMTMDFNTGRLNIRKDASGTIDRVWCG